MKQDPTFNEFLKNIGFDIPVEYIYEDTKYDDFFNGVKIKYYVGTYMDEESIRQHIGNLQCIIIFYDDTETFDVNSFLEFGQMNQIFILVQAYLGSKYRIRIFHKKMDHFKPFVPKDYLFSNENIRDFILTKLYNGLVQLRINSLISYQFTAPRESALEDIIRNSIKNKKSKQM